MSNDALIEKIETIQQKQTKYKLIFGTILGVTLMIYFFTFAMLVDKFPPAFYIFEAVTTPIIFILFFFLNRMSFAMIRNGFQKKEEFREIIGVMTQGDIDTKPEKIAQRLA